MRGSRARSAHVCTITPFAPDGAQVIGLPGGDLRPPFAPDGALDDAARVRAGLEALGLTEWALVP
jgi:hypothetical protein